MFWNMPLSKEDLLWLTRSSADADNALDANEAVPNKWRADGTHNTYQSY